MLTVLYSGVYQALLASRRILAELDRRGVPRASRLRAKREHPRRISGLWHESQGHNLALTVLYVPGSLDSASERAMVVDRMGTLIGFMVQGSG